MQDFYMDDYLAGANDVDSAIHLATSVSKILSSGGFQLRKWSSNNRTILDLFENSNEHNDTQHIIKDEQNSKTLGALWVSTTDSLKYTTNTNQHKIFTKRLILSIISQIFDPLGLISPVITKAKLFVQKLWQLKTSWDDPIHEDFLKSWLQFYNEISLLDDLEFPRQMVIKNYTRIDLHVFTDASQSCYGSCVYIWSRNELGDILVRLACSKSRVAPLKIVSLPRLELCGALLGAQLSRRVLDALKIKFNNVYFWCDSTIVLAWINSEPSRQKTFVSNRVAKIQNLSQPPQWRQVPTNLNPADYVSRGVFPREMKSLSRWRNGPDYLYKNEEFWPHSKVSISEDELPEMKLNETVLLAREPVKNDIILKYSSMTKLLRIIAYILRFKYNCLRENKFSRIVGPIAINELNTATQIVIKIVQRESFLPEIQALEKSKFISKNSRLITLDPFLDEHNILRVGGRLKNAKLIYNTKHPAILPSKNHFTYLVIRHEHFRNLHAGPQTLLAIIRQNYWPLSGRRTVRGILRKCLVCFRAAPPVLCQKMGDLPASRVNPSRPFSICGIDYAGPYQIKNSYLRNTKFVKAWICIFICFSTKAMHLELVTELSTDSFLNAFKRFIARRGLCSDIYSDNASNFVGANNFLNKVNEPVFQGFLSDSKVNWHFIPSRSPHVGGLWESAVRVTKYHLKRILQNVSLNYEEFYSMLVQVESIVNSRSLVPLTEDPEDLDILTPGHFLIGTSLRALPEPSVDDSRHTHVNRYRYLKLLIQQFWGKWSQDYLHSLQQRSKWQRPYDIFKIGQLVLLREDNTPPLSWKIGRISEIHPGQDGHIRVVSVKTCDGLFKRAVTKICVLPHETENTDK